MSQSEFKSEGKVNLLKVAVTVEDALETLPFVRDVDLLSLKDGEKGVRLKIVVTEPFSYELFKEISRAISEAKWKIFRKTGELPIVDWELIYKPQIKSIKEINPLPLIERF
jgi:hypothetical protein